MAYTKNYYHILGLAAPGWGGAAKEQGPAAVELRRAYKLALLAVHPDTMLKTKKEREREGSGNAAGGKTGKKKAFEVTYTVDEVKEAYGVLIDGKKKAEFDNWLLGHHGGGDAWSELNTQEDGLESERLRQQQGMSSDFVLGLESLDLSDFHMAPSAELGAPNSHTSIVSTGTNTTTTNTTIVSGDSTGDYPAADTSEEQTEWTRACRCGADKGFRILESELEDAEGKGEKEVLVGCEGCSLWVRVGFDVEGGEGSLDKSKA